VAIELSPHQELIYREVPINLEKLMDVYFEIFKKHAKWLLLLYGALCTLYVLGVILSYYFSLGMVIGNFMILLFFFLSIPAGILDRIIDRPEIGSIYIIRLADINAYLACMLICIFNIIFSLIIASVSSLIVLKWQQLYKKIRNKE